MRSIGPIAEGRASCTCSRRRPAMGSKARRRSGLARGARPSRRCSRFIPMTLVTTSAVVLRTYPYSETSKIVRLATRDLGGQSAIAKGVLRPRSRFAAGLGLLSEGMAPLDHRETRQLPTLAPFDPPGLRRQPG